MVGPSSSYPRRFPELNKSLPKELSSYNVLKGQEEIFFIHSSFLISLRLTLRVAPPLSIPRLVTTVWVWSGWSGGDWWPPALLLVAMPFVTSSFLLLAVPGATSTILATGSHADHVEHRI